MDDVARDLHASLTLRNESTKHLVVENIYVRSQALLAACVLVELTDICGQREIPEAEHNVQIWCQASHLAEAKPHLKRVRNGCICWLRRSRS